MTVRGRHARVTRRRPVPACVAAALLLLPAAGTAAQPSGYAAHELAPGVVAMIREPGPAADGNVLIIINEHDVVVVDANIFPASARQTVAEIRKRTSKPVRYLINTHWHSDHHYGNQVFVEAYPGVEIVQHVQTRRDVIERDIPALARNLATEYPAVVTRLKRAIETGRTSTGAIVTDSMRASFTKSLALYEFFLRDMEGTRLVPATLTVSDSIVLHRGERTIVVKHLGRGNTAGDLVVHLPRERIVATGDLVVHPIPYAFFSHLGDWPATLRALRTLDAGTIMPGHGELQRDWSYVDRLIPLIESTWSQVRAAVAAGADLDSTRARVRLDAFRDAFAGQDIARRRSFDALFVMPGVEAAFRELKADSTPRP